ncbi:unnamed protein product [Ostreobium quekettii]|uniref:Kinesin light chain n=1 Tax=Ostreobium quekettii TaxID=121088 RepID=A0A8S1IPA6_9CHLO|nr:unnamed protein product [Ostreobium quekettii]
MEGLRGEVGDLRAEVAELSHHKAYLEEKLLGVMGEASRAKLEVARLRGELEAAEAASRASRASMHKWEATEASRGPEPKWQSVGEGGLQVWDAKDADMGATRSCTPPLQPQALRPQGTLDTPEVAMRVDGQQQNDECGAAIVGSRSMWTGSQRFDSASSSPQPHEGIVFSTLGRHTPSWGGCQAVNVSAQDPSTVASLHEAARQTAMGVALRARGRHRESEEAHRRALDIRRHALGDNHPAVIESWNSLGYALLHEGKVTEAEDAFREALVHLKTGMNDCEGPPLLGQGARPEGADSSPDGGEGGPSGRRRSGGALSRCESMAMADSLNGMGLVHRSQGRLEMAKTVLCYALDVRKRSLGDACGSHPMVAVGLNNLGLVLEQVGELAEAEECFSKAVEMWRRDHEEVVMSAENLSRVREKRLAASDAKEEADNMCG